MRERAERETEIQSENMLKEYKRSGICPMAQDLMQRNQVTHRQKNEKECE